MGDEHLANVLGTVALRLVTEIEAAIRASTGLTGVQSTALSALANYAQGGSTEQLSRAVDLSHSATVRLVDRLAADGLVRRSPDAADRRVSAVLLTARGRRLVESIRVARRGVLDEVVAQVPAGERALLSHALDGVLSSAIAPAPAGAEASRYVCRLCDWAACGHPDGCPVTRAVR